MKNKINKNYIFFIVVSVFFVLIGCFNYFVDANRLFRRNDYMELFEKTNRMIPFVIEHTKNIKNDTLLIGFSEPHLNFSEREFNKEYFNQLFFSYNNYKGIYEHIEQYLRLHPETKHVKFFVSYNSFFFFFYIEQTLKKNAYFDKFIYLFFSKDITEKNYEKFYWDISNKFHEILNKFIPKTVKEDSFLYEYIPNFIPYSYKSEEELDKIEKENYEYIDKIIDLFEKNNIEYEIIIPQYNAIYLVSLDNKKQTKRLERIKRHLVNRAGVVYDFAFVNRLTSTNLLDGSNYIYYLPDHPNKFFGYKLFKFLFYREDADKDIYLTLTKKNIEQQLKKEDILLRDFIKNNRAYVYYYTIPLERTTEYFDEKNVPQEFLDDREYIENKIKEKHSKQQ